ncbi:hypothetical protein LJ737_01780 [Hymenobacter sp. 15J16-1T3B]|uniref:hypothetical protein n=1 Tax=Hymenobacter sp. 15J16-1T3B TaxID=2886941 RepID=UPI001D0FE8FD|nr:hypothetical protein [Hymenobacter sp. 15J16-1T3B]MCC3155949.1 hypothetical protein [Hymenobacter sp. 15J16-1T3B]
MMKQREVTDKHNTTWTCAQAYAAVESTATEQAVEKSETDEGNVPVVCTPSGGAQTVRLELPKDWFDNLPDDELAQAIQAAQ